MNKAKSTKDLQRKADASARVDRVTRVSLLTQLRHAVHLLESPRESVVEFEVGSVGFCFEFDDDEEGGDEQGS